MPNKNHIAIIGTVGIPSRYGGFETLAQELITSLSDRFDFTVYCSGKSYQKAERIPSWKSANLSYIPLPANGIMSVFYDIWSMIHALRYADLLLILGVSGCMFLPILKLISSKPIIVNLDGIEWKREKWTGPAKWFLRVSERMAVRYADRLISDNKGIRKAIIHRYGRDSSTIAYGGDQAFNACPKLTDYIRYRFLSDKYACKVCRIEPENNIELILKAFSSQDIMPLALVGNWQHSAWSKALYQQYASHPNLFLLDPIYEPRVLNVLRSNAALYIHGHQAGGTNPSLVEAMSLGLPILAYDVIFNRETTEHETLYFTDEESLKVLLATPLKDLVQVGVTMESIARRRYTWNAISNAYAGLFAEALGPEYSFSPNQTLTACAA